MNKPGWVDKITDRLDDADFLKKYHKWATIWWSTFGLVLSVIWKSWLPWVVFMSLYANIAGEWAAWQASRVEVRQNEIAEEGAPLPDAKKKDRPRKYRGGLAER